MDLYCYNFCTNSNRLIYQPTGAQNTNKWQYITFEFNTIQPPRNQDPDDKYCRCIVRRFRCYYWSKERLMDA